MLPPVTETRSVCVLWPRGRLALVEREPEAAFGQTHCFYFHPKSEGSQGESCQPLRCLEEMEGKVRAAPASTWGGVGSLGALRLARGEQFKFTRE